MAKNKSGLRRRKKQASSAREPKQYKGNAQQIKSFMDKNKVKGDPRDYVLVFEHSMMDYLGSYNIRSADGGGIKSLANGGVALIHKKKLRFILGEESAKTWWHPKLGRLGAKVQPPKKC